MATLFEQLDAMQTLEPNWDGYDGDPITPAVVDLAKEFVALIAAVRGADDPYRGMHVTPGRDGGVLVEWDDASHQHELEINPDGSLGFLHTNRLSGEMAERRFPPSTQAIHPGVVREIRELVVA